MEFLKDNVMGIVFTVMIFGITFLGSWSNSKMEYNEELEQQEYLSANIY